MYFALVQKYRRLNASGDQLFQFLDFTFIALVEGPLFDAFCPDESRLQQDLHVLAGGGLTHVELPGDQHAAYAVLHQIPVHLRREMPAGVLQPVENLQAAVIRQSAQSQFHFHIDN